MNRKIAIIGIATLILAAIISPTAQAIQDPYIIEITVIDEDGNPVQGATVRVTHIRTGESNTTLTNVDGWAWFPLETLATYSNGDEVLIEVTKDTLSTEYEFTVDISTGNEDGHEPDEPLVISEQPINLGDGDYNNVLIVLGIIIVIGILLGIAALRKEKKG